MKEFPDVFRNVSPEAQKPSLDTSTYEKPALVDTLGAGFTDDESNYFMQMGFATTQEELNSAIQLFNDASGPKSSEELGMSLEDMLIEDQVVTLASGFKVQISRTRSGVVSFQNPAHV